MFRFPEGSGSPAVSSVSEVFHMQNITWFKRRSGIRHGLLSALALLAAGFCFSETVLAAPKPERYAAGYGEYVVIDDRSGNSGFSPYSETAKPVPQTCSKTWRLAVVQMGSYYDFRIIMNAMLKKLYRDGYFIMDPEMADGEYLFDNPEVWKKLSDNSRGGCIELIPDGFYTADWDDQDLWEQETERLRRRILDDRDVDILLGMGVAAGMKFADSELGIPVMIADPSSPETAGIIGPGEYSDKPNVHVQKYPKRTSMAIRSYLSIFNFKKLGIMVDRDVTIRRMQSFDVIRKVADEEGFQVIPCFGEFQDRTDMKNVREFERCRAELLSQKIDAVYMPIFDGTETENYFSSIKPFIDEDIIVIGDGNTGSTERVERGVLVSLVEVEIDESGRFEAGVLEQIINGTPPEKISQYYRTNLSFALNLKTALLVNWKPSFEFLMMVEYLFENINFK